MFTRSLVTKTVLASALLSLASCAPENSADGVSADEEALLGGAGRRGWRITELSTTPVMDAEGIGEAGSTRTAVAIRNDRQYEKTFGHAAPDDVDFGSELVLFYSAGVQPTGGYVASIVKVVQLGNSLSVVTHLSIPGDNCVTTDALTTPHALVTVTPARPVRHVRFQHLRSVVDCEPPPSCDDVMCPDGQHCELQEIVCITTPCNPIPTCVDDDVDPEPPFCGGIAGFTCPGAGECVDDPSDDCDPNMGGADCGGLCECNAIGLCVDGFVWDGSPEVCGCVAVEENPCDLVRCMAGTHCVVQDGEAVCEPDAEPPFCGGFGGFPCPGAGECVDDPGDDCDPNMGGADCGGLCECNAIGLCEDGLVWDASPQVCGCVPEGGENPCNLIDCPPNSICEVQGGEAVCVPVDVEPNPCAFTLCMVGTECIVEDGEAVCVPITGGGEACGDSTCAMGEVCCNESCGICTPPDGACIDLFCEPKR